MRILMLFTIGFGMACAMGAYWLYGFPVWMLAVLLLVISIVCAVLFREGPRRRLAVCLLGAACGFAYFQGYDALLLSDAKKLDGATGSMTLTAVDYSAATDYGIRVDGEAEFDGRILRVRAYVDTEQQLVPGDSVSGQFRLRYTGYGGLEDATHHSGSGIFLLAYPSGESQISRGEHDAIRYVPVKLRQYLLALLQEAFPGDSAPFARALFLGDSSQLDYETNTALSISGIRHVVAVSGLHVSMLFSLVYTLAGKRRGLTAALGIPVLILFALTAGMTPSIVRACIMQILMLLAMLCKREYDAPTSLAFASLCMLVMNPLVITSVSFQLSVGSMAGIFLFSARVYGRIRSWPVLRSVKGKDWRSSFVHWFVGSISITLSAMTLTSPLVAYHFNAVSLIGVLTNLLTLWVVTFVFCGIFAVCLMGMIWLPAAKAVAYLLSWPIRFVLGAANILSKFPLAAVYTVSPYIVAWLAVCYVLFAVFLLSGRKRVVFLSCCAAISLGLALLASWIEPLLGSYRMTVLDVGQGQCVLLQAEGKTYMVDCGGEYDEDVADLAAETLLSQGVTRLDGMILTHYDSDHVCGAELLLARIPTDVLILPTDTDEKALAPVLTGLCGEEVVTAYDDMTIGWGSSQISVFSAVPGTSGNESSLSVLFHTEKCDILITGDLTAGYEAVLAAEHTLPQLTALVVGHHGAASSTSEALLKQTRPELALISVGEDNRYNHPAQTVLDRLTQYGCQIRRTDLEGTIIIRG